MLRSGRCYGSEVVGASRQALFIYRLLRLAEGVLRPVSELKRSRIIKTPLAKLYLDITEHLH